MATYDGNPKDYQGLIENGYEFDLGAYLSRGWELFKQNVSGFIAYVFVFFISVVVISLVGQMLGFGNPIFTAIMGQVSNIPVVGLGAGFLIMAHKIARGQEFEFGTFFEGLKDMIQIWLGSFVIGIFSMIPVLIGLYIALGTEIFDLYTTLQDTQYIFQNSEEFLATLAPFGAKMGLYGGIGVLVSLLISALFSFTTPFILFGRLSFWDAMESSRKIISQKLLNFLLLWLVLGLSFAALCTIPAFIAGVTGSGLLMGIAALVIVGGAIIFGPYVSCVSYAAFEGIVLNNVSGSEMDNFIDEIGSE